MLNQITIATPCFTYNIQDEAANTLTRFSANDIVYVKRKYFKLMLIIICFCLLLTSCSYLTEGKSGDAYFDMALKYYEDEDYVKTIEYCEQAVLGGVDKYSLEEVYITQGRSNLESDFYEEAIRCYEMALELNNDNHEIWTSLGVAHRQNGDYNKAAECYEKSLEIEPNYAETYSSLGSLNIILGEHKTAITYFETAIGLDPSIAVAHGNLALALAMDGRFEDAEKALAQAKVLGYKNHVEIQKRIDALKNVT